MNTEEMYQRGIADAERGELHPFYYQHYYHYRRGYDRTRRRMRRPGVDWGKQPRWRKFAFVIAALLSIGAGAYVLRERSQTTAAISTAVAAPTRAASTTTSARTPIFPTNTPEPSPEAQGLRIGGAALVANTAGQPLRGRAQPGLKAPAKVGFKEGERVTILEGPVEADGYIWWRIESKAGAGWSAERSKEGMIWLQPAADS